MENVEKFAIAFALAARQAAGIHRRMYRIEVLPNNEQLRATSSTNSFVTSVISPNGSSFERVVAITPHPDLKVFYPKYRESGSILQFMTNITSVAVHPRSDVQESLNITFNYVLPKIFRENPRNSTALRFWDNMTRTWSEEGCQSFVNESFHLTAHCDHLTSFAILFQISEADIPEPIEISLSVITKAGLYLSILCILSLLIVYRLLGRLDLQTKIYQQLAISMFFNCFIFLLLEKASTRRWSCTLEMVLLYYFSLSSISWMMAGTFYIYASLTENFHFSNMRAFSLVGWGLPVLLLLANSSVFVARYKLDPELCWLSPEDHSIWAFAIPAMIILISNLVFMVLIVAKIMSDEFGMRSKLFMMLRGVIFLYPVTGSSWLFGLLSFWHFQPVVFQYLFAFTNAFQGLFLAIFHCFSQTSVKEKLFSVETRVNIFRCLTFKLQPCLNLKQKALKDQLKSPANDHTKEEQASEERKSSPLHGVVQLQQHSKIQPVRPISHNELVSLDENK